MGLSQLNPTNTSFEQLRISGRMPTPSITPRHCCTVTPIQLFFQMPCTARPAHMHTVRRSGPMPGFTTDRLLCMLGHARVFAACAKPP